MYGKIFESIYDGTLAGDWRALITFQQFIILSNPDGIVDMTPEAIARRTGIPIEHIISGIEILEKTDRYSRTPDEEGRRLELIDSHRPWGWHIVNHEKYRDIKNMDMVREQTRLRVKKHRENKRLENNICNNNIVTNVTVTESNTKKRHTDTDTDTDTNTKEREEKPKSSRFTPPLLNEITSYCLHRKNSIDPEQFINFYESKGWMIGKNKMKSWKACIITWEKRNPQQKTDNYGEGGI